MKMLIDRFDLERIFRLYEAQDYSTCLQEVKKASEAIGHSTPWLSWVRAVCEDMEGEPFQALICVKEALAGDPYNFYYLSSLMTITNRFKTILVSYLDNEETYEAVMGVKNFLVEAGEYTSTHQYLVAKNLIKRERFKEAHEILSVYLVNNPKDAEALELEKIVEDKIGIRLAS